MDNEIISNLTLSAQEQLVIQNEILQGKFGQPGNVFMTTRALSEAYQVSVVTAHKIMKGLCSAGYIKLQGKRYYLTHSELSDAENNQKNVIGLLIPQLNNEFYASLSEEVTNFARQNGYKVLILCASYQPDEEQRAINFLCSQKVAGIINCIPTPRENSHLYQSLPIPCVMLGHSLDKSKLSSVQVNSFTISQKVAQHLVEEGYQKFLYISTKNIPLENDIRFTGFRMELNRCGFELNTQDILRISFHSKADDELLTSVLLAQQEPVGVFCYHDLIAAQLYRICAKLGKPIPEAVGIVGFDDLSIASSLYPSLTTVQYRTSTMAEMAFNLLCAAIKSPDVPYDNYYIEPNLVIRKSSVRASGRPASGEECEAYVD